MSFEDIDFDAAIKEAEFEDLSDWEFFVECDGVKIYRLYIQVMLLCSQMRGINVFGGGLVLAYLDIFIDKK